jgi:hypothetical protein
MPIWNFCFIAGAAAGVTGMALGIAMGLSHDFSLTPVHAHVNLLGWASMMLYGLYYRGLPWPTGPLAWVQVTAATAGFAAMSGGLWLVLSGQLPSAEPVVAVGALLSIGAIILFLALVVRDSLRPRQP